MLNVQFEQAVELAEDFDNAVGLCLAQWNDVLNQAAGMKGQILCYLNN